jgi:hypothetical protein
VQRRDVREERTTKGGELVSAQRVGESAWDYAARATKDLSRALRKHRVQVLAEVWADVYDSPDPKDHARCITHTKRAIAVLARLNVPARPCAVRALAANAAALPYVFRVPVSEWPPEAHSVGIMLEPIDAQSQAEPHRRKATSIHVVAVGDGWLFDPTARQFHRGLRDIIVPGPLVLPVPEGEDVIRADLERGGLIVYGLRPEVAAFRTTNAWQAADLGDVPALVSEVERRLGDL